ncbi:MAG: ribosome recycling factor [Flavobacteriales bacterium]|nr:ribosome recycling factor [Flavobacteriales bacterium]
MTEEIQMAIDEATASMDNSMQHLASSLTKIRAGKANPSMLDSVQVAYYGSLTPLSQVANVNTIDARTISVQPWEKSLLEDITKGIINANLGLNPQNNGELIMINVPVLTEERRKDLSKRAKAEGEHAKVGIRNARKDANDFIKSLKNDGLSEDLAKDAESGVQDLTNKFTIRIDNLVTAKEKDIMTV